MVINMNTSEWQISDIHQDAENWSLSSDVNMLQFLKSFSERMFGEFNQTRESLAEIISFTEEVATQVNNTFNDFDMLSNVQFIESRVYEDDETNADDESQQLPEISEEETSEVIGGRIKTSIEYGLTVLEAAYSVRNIDESDANSELVIEANDPYSNRNLPFLIGSSEYCSDDTAGIALFYQSDEESVKSEDEDEDYEDDEEYEEEEGDSSDGKKEEIHPTIDLSNEEDTSDSDSEAAIEEQIINQQNEPPARSNSIFEKPKSARDNVFESIFDSTDESENEEEVENRPEANMGVAPPPTLPEKTIPSPDKSRSESVSSARSHKNPKGVPKGAVSIFGGRTVFEGGAIKVLEDEDENEEETVTAPPVKPPSRGIFSSSEEESEEESKSVSNTRNSSVAKPSNPPIDTSNSAKKSVGPLFDESSSPEPAVSPVKTNKDRGAKSAATFDSIFGPDSGEESDDMFGATTVSKSKKEKTPDPKPAQKTAPRSRLFSDSDTEEQSPVSPAPVTKVKEEKPVVKKPATKVKDSIFDSSDDDDMFDSVPKEPVGKKVLPNKATVPQKQESKKKDVPKITSDDLFGSDSDDDDLFPSSSQAPKPKSEADQQKKLATSLMAEAMSKSASKVQKGKDEDKKIEESVDATKRLSTKIDTKKSRSLFDSSEDEMDAGPAVTKKVDENPPKAFEKKSQNVKKEETKTEPASKEVQKPFVDLLATDSDGDDLFPAQAQMPKPGTDEQKQLATSLIAEAMTKAAKTIKQDSMADKKPEEPTKAETKTIKSLFDSSDEETDFSPKPVTKAEDEPKRLPIQDPVEKQPVQDDTTEVQQDTAGKGETEKTPPQPSVPPSKGLFDSSDNEESDDDMFKRNPVKTEPLPKSEPVKTETQPIKIEPAAVGLGQNVVKNKTKEKSKPVPDSPIRKPAPISDDSDSDDMFKPPIQTSSSADVKSEKRRQSQLSDLFVADSDEDMFSTPARSGSRTERKMSRDLIPPAFPEETPVTEKSKINARAAKFDDIFGESDDDGEDMFAPKTFSKVADTNIEEAPSVIPISVPEEEKTSVSKVTEKSEVSTADTTPDALAGTTLAAAPKLSPQKAEVVKTPQDIPEPKKDESSAETVASSPTDIKVSASPNSKIAKLGNSLKFNPAMLMGGPRPIKKKEVVEEAAPDSPTETTEVDGATPKAANDGQPSTPGVLQSVTKGRAKKGGRRPPSRGGKSPAAPTPHPVSPAQPQPVPEIPTHVEHDEPISNSPIFSFTPPAVDKVKTTEKSQERSSEQSAAVEKVSSTEPSSVSASTSKSKSIFDDSLFGDDDDLFSDKPKLSKAADRDRIMDDIFADTDSGPSDRAKSSRDAVFDDIFGDMPETKRKPIDDDIDIFGETSHKEPKSRATKKSEVAPAPKSAKSETKAAGKSKIAAKAEVDIFADDFDLFGDISKPVSKSKTKKTSKKSTPKKTTDFDDPLFG